MQESIHKVSLQLTEYWKEMDKKKKIRLVLISLFIIFAVTALILTLTRTKYEVLYGDLSLKDMGQITTKLDEMGTPWKTGDDQKSILVPAESKNRIKIELATYGLPKEGYTYMDAFNDSSWTMTDYDKKQRMKLALQSELASTISEIDGIHSAEVYIAEKETTNFILNNNDDDKTTASVFIVKDSGGKLSGEKVKAIKHLISGPINIDPENVRVVDDEGRLLEEENENDVFAADQFAVKHNLETRINDSIKKFLENIVGLGNVDVMSSVKINMDIENTTIVEFSPPIEGNEEGLIRSLEEVEEHMVGGATGGIPGTDTNVEDYQMVDDGSSRYDKVSRIINNELNEINKEIRKTPGQVESVTVAVLINKDALVDGEMTPEREKEFSDLIFAATGLDTKQVQVKAVSFNKQAVDTNILQGKSNNWLYIGIILLVLLILAIIIYMRLKAKKSATDELERMLEERSSIELEVADLDFDAEESKMKAQIDKFIEKKPDSVAQLLRNWLNE
ncbi:flagellar M-ring protein FliF [Tissierella sp. P1]|uniref:flagellar basal-body MS-ring/collar protein FliF n=1 Tax=Tissierella TaxID=41273 RepID=UPI000BA13631|nr:flagellar basal-body MS-ring/collar protein FliF [Tissierella sp. P1]MDU5079874.1 flagellar basal-body MS-ring/collar protein FliF [Bacillota bacterium]OZV12899.1 flagellar M-ring protein FliF [Tissierella sp. P1]